MKFEKGQYLKCFKSVWSGGVENKGVILFKRGNSYGIVNDSTALGHIYIIDDFETKRPISLNRQSSNAIRVYWKDNFTSRDYSLSKLIGD